MANPTLLTMPLCVNADKNTIPSTDAGTSGAFSEEYGWQNINSLPLASGGKAPNRRDFNGVFALLGGIAYACQRGQTFEWVNNLPYLKGCVVTDPLDGNKYNAKNDVAEGGTNPSLDSTNWERFGTDTTILANTDLSNLSVAGEAKFTGKADTDLGNLTQTGEDHFLEQDFTIIYPNNGTEANPSALAISTRYVEVNPFPGYYVACEFEVYHNSIWSKVTPFSPNSGTGSTGVNVGMYGNDKIVIQISINGYFLGNGGSARNGDLFGGVDVPITAPCRVKVWKIGKIPT